MDLQKELGELYGCFFNRSPFLQIEHKYFCQQFEEKRNLHPISELPDIPGRDELQPNASSAKATVTSPVSTVLPPTTLPAATVNAPSTPKTISLATMQYLEQFLLKQSGTILPNSKQMLDANGDNILIGVSRSQDVIRQQLAKEDHHKEVLAAKLEALNERLKIERNKISEQEVENRKNIEIQSNEAIVQTQKKYAATQETESNAGRKDS